VVEHRVPVRAGGERNGFAQLERVLNPTERDSRAVRAWGSAFSGGLRLPDFTAKTPYARGTRQTRLRALEWLSRSPSRPMHPAWLRCSSVTY